MSPDDRNNLDRGFDDRAADRGFEDRGFDDRAADRGFSDRAADREFSDRNQFASDRELEDRALEDRALEQQLADSGRQARLYAGGMSPNPIYSAQLRERLVSQLETAPAPFVLFAFRQRIGRVLPLAVLTLLLAAAAVGAAQLNVGAPAPSESPVAVTDEQEPTAKPASSPAASGNGLPVVPVATPKPTPATTPTPKPEPGQNQAPPPPASTPKPTPVPPPPGPAPMTLSLKSCDGGVVIGWSKYKSGGFNHYTTLRNTVNNVPLAYPPQGGAVDFGGTYSTDFTVTSAVDTSGAPFATYYYRTMAFNVADQVIGASAVGSAQALPMVSLGTLGALDVGGGSTSFSWTPYGGHGACFTYYKLVASTTNPNPSYLTGDQYLYAGSGQGESSTVISGLATGQTYYVRVQAIKSTALGMFVAGQTDVLTFVAP